MKCLLVLALVLPFCLTIEVNFTQTYGNSIKKIEIPSCVAEPCPLVKGQPLDMSITVDTVYPPQEGKQTVTDLDTSINMGAYRNRFVYYLAESQSFCKFQPNVCPLHLNGLYTINRRLFLSVDDESTERTAEGSGNGKRWVRVQVGMKANDQDFGTIIGGAAFILDIQKGEK